MQLGFYDVLTLSMIVVLISITATGITMFWRTCIYTRGGIFRPIGRILDKWVSDACTPTAGVGRKILRFIAYPLGRCVFCFSFHITYDLFLLLNWKLQLNLDPWLLLFIIPLTQLFVIATVKYLIIGNEGVEKDDWEYMKNNTDKVWDFKRRLPKYESVLTPEEELQLEICKSGINNTTI